MRRAATPSKSGSSDVPVVIGHALPNDLKDGPLRSFHGCRYYLVYADHYSMLSLAIFLRSKVKVPDKLRQYPKEMRKLAPLFDKCSLTKELNSPIKKAMLLKSVPDRTQSSLKFALLTT